MNDEIVLIDREALIAELRRSFDEQTAEMLLRVLDRVASQVVRRVPSRDEIAELWRMSERLLQMHERAAEEMAALRASQQETDRRLAELAQAQARTEESISRLSQSIDRLEGRVQELAEAQKRTEEHLQELELRVEALAEAQKRTEERVEELAEAQKRTEERLQELELRVEALAEAQKRTEEHLQELELRVEALAEAQKRTEERLQELELRVEALAEAQKRTEEHLQELELRVEALAEAQKRTEERLQELELRVEALAEAQERTERALQNLAKQVGGLSDTLGGDIEDIAYIVIHDVLTREFGWDVGLLERTWQRWNGSEEEVDVFGQATDPSRPGTTIWIVGEAKHNLSAREVERFIGLVERAKEHLEGEIFPVCFCYRIRPEVRKRVLEAGLRLVLSYGRLV